MDLAAADLNRHPVFVVDDDVTVRETLSLVLRVEGFEPLEFSDGVALMEALATASPACVILDVDLPHRSGLDILKALAAEKFPPPVVVISGHSNIAVAVEAMKVGALDFLEKPFPAADLVDRVRIAVAAWRKALNGVAERLGNFPGRHRLTDRECEVLTEIADGLSNKETARRLGISPRTVEVHRAHIMEKLGAKNAADLMRIVLSVTERRSSISAG